jgi:hypothetical protein
MFCSETDANLYQLKDGRFQIITKGKITPLMIGYDYVLVEKKFADYLEQLNLPELDIEEAIIYYPTDKTEIRTHRQLKIGECLSADINSDIDLDGERILLRDSDIFVSPQLKKRLEGSEFNYLGFSEGLSLFAA